MRTAASRAGRQSRRVGTASVLLRIQYIDTWSLWLDIKIQFKTVPVVLLHKGAT